MKRKNIIKRRLKCCVCGGEAGHWEQWHNQDTGWGVCRTCVDWISTKESTKACHNELLDPLQFARTYGLAGKNYEPTKFQRHLGKDFAVVASYPYGEQGAKDANEFMSWFNGASVLGIFDGRIILAMSDDLGREPSD